MLTYPRNLPLVLTACNCFFAVISVKSARQVIDALNAEGPGIDIILSELDLPMSKGLKMLKYVMRHEELHRIPVITEFGCSAFHIRRGWIRC